MNAEQNTSNVSILLAQGFSETIVSRFWEKVVKGTNGCWLWTGATNARHGKFPYGKISIGKHSGKNDYAHRVSWILHRGEIPDGMEVLHNCPTGDNSLCVNPDHLFLGTHKENFEDAARKGRMHRGYKLTDEDVLKIIRMRHTHTGKELSAMFGVGQVLISQILHGQRYQRVWAQLTIAPLNTDGRLKTS